MKASPKLYECPLCDENSGSVGTRSELLEHLKQDHIEEQTIDDFLGDILDAFLSNYAYISGLRGLDKK